MSESELRQRNVAQDDKDSEIERLKAELAKAKKESVMATTSEEVMEVRNDGDDTPENREKMIKEIQEKLLASVKTDIKPGLGNAAHKAKSAMDKDPMNMELILNCGRAYTHEERWDRTVNVLLRGYKRVSEFKDPETRFEFLLLLAQGSIKMQQYKQAFAALGDMEEPDDDDNMLTFLVCATQTYGFNGDTAKALKCCNRMADLAEKNDSWDPIFGAYCASVPAMKTCGAYDAAKSSLMGRLKSDEMRSKLDALERLSEIREELREAVQPKAATGQRKMMFLFGLFMLLIGFLGILYQLEKHSLANFSAK